MTTKKKASQRKKTPKGWSLKTFQEHLGALLRRAAKQGLDFGDLREDYIVKGFTEDGALHVGSTLKYKFSVMRSRR